MILIKNIAFKVLKLALKGMLLYTSICVIAALHSLLFSSDFKMGFYPGVFVSEFLSAFRSLFSLWTGSIVVSSLDRSVDLYDFLPKTYLYSMTILFSSLVAAAVLAFAVSYTYLFLPIRIKQSIRTFLSAAESIPDIFVILSFQFAVIYTYKQTGFKFLQIYGLETNVYIMPILCMVFVPLFMLIRIMITIFDEEYEKTYVDFARAKGLTAREVFTGHVFRNVLYSFLQYLGMIYWVMLSGLALIEYLFIMDGITVFIYRFASSEVLAISIFLLLLPYGLLKGAVVLLARKRGVAA